MPLERQTDVWWFYKKRLHFGSPIPSFICLLALVRKIGKMSNNVCISMEFQVKNNARVIILLIALVAMLAFGLSSTISVQPVSAQQGATPTMQAPEMVSNPYGETLTLVLSDVFPDDVVSYYEEDAPTPSGAIASNEMVTYTIPQVEYITCSGGGFTFGENMSVLPILGTGSFTYLNLGPSVTFTMSANPGTWCTRGAITGNVVEAAQRVAGMYTRALLAGGAPAVEAHVLINTRNAEYHWAGVVDTSQLVLVEQTGQGGGGEIGVEDWENAVIPTPSGPDNWPARLDTTQFNTIQTTEECWIENNPNFSCTTQERQPTTGSFDLLSGVGLRMSGDGISIFDDTCQNLLIERPQDGITDWWFIVNDSTEDLHLCMVAPNGSDRSYFALGNDASWTTETVDLMVRNGMRQFLQPEQTVLSVTTPTPQPNCGSFTEGCRRTNVRALSYSDPQNWDVLYYGVVSEIAPFWTPILPIPGINWAGNG